MKKYYPSNYEKFSCIASDCPDTCCAKWEINIDSATLGLYEALPHNACKFIKERIIKTENDEFCFQLEKGSCPFLNNRKLCDIHIAYGEEYTPEVCRQHPRFIEEYDGFTEICLSASCPAASKLLFSDSGEAVIYPTPEYKGDDEILALLIESRCKLLNITNNDFITLKDNLLDKAADDLLDINLIYVSEHTNIDNDYLIKYISLLSDECVILTDEWKDLLKTTLDSSVSNEQLNNFISDENKKLTDFCRYLIYRYYLKAVNNIDIYSIALFIIFSCYSCSMISVSSNVPFEEVCRLYSKETEHFPDNTETALKFFDNI